MRRHNTLPRLIRCCQRIKTQHNHQMATKGHFDAQYEIITIDYTGQSFAIQQSFTLLNWLVFDHLMASKRVMEDLEQISQPQMVQICFNVVN